MTHPIWAPNIDTMDLRRFVAESNRIEGINRRPLKREIDAHFAFLILKSIWPADVSHFVGIIAPHGLLREREGMDVRVGNHVPPAGGHEIPERLDTLMIRARSLESPWAVHLAYETLHPYLDGNGRSGRAVWLWMMLNQGRDHAALRRGFLHSFYYQTLAESRS